MNIKEELNKCLDAMTEENMHVFVQLAPFPLKKKSYTIEELKQVYRKFPEGKALITSIDEIEESLGFFE